MHCIYIHKYSSGYTTSLAARLNVQIFFNWCTLITAARTVSSFICPSRHEVWDNCRLMHIYWAPIEHTTHIVRSSTNLNRHATQGIILDWHAFTDMHFTDMQFTTDWAEAWRITAFQGWVIQTFETSHTDKYAINTTYAYNTQTYFCYFGGYPGLAPTTLQPPRIVPPASKTL